MAFSGNKYSGTFTPEEVTILQSTYDEVCKILGRCPTTDTNKEQLARAIISMFEQGNTEPKYMAGNIIQAEKYLIK